MAGEIERRDAALTPEECEALREVARAEREREEARARRGPRVELGGGRCVPIGLVVEVQVPRRLLFLEEMPDGAIRLTVSSAWGLDVGAIGAVRLEPKEEP